MKKILLSLALFISGYGRAQETVKNYVIQNAVPVETVDPDSTGFSDLDAIGKAIGGARIVMLGEQDHGDAVTFLAKSRLIKYLHEVKHFDVLAFESDFFGLNFGWEQAGKGAANLDSVVRKNVFQDWSECSECSNLLCSYLPACSKTSAPLQLAGIDCSMNSRILAAALDSVLRACHLPITGRPDYAGEIAPSLIIWGANLKDSARNHRFLDNLAEMRHQLDSALGPGTIWSQAIANFQVNDYYWSNPGLNYYQRMALRDQQMAENLRWLAEVKYPHSRIIVWAHNYHISKYNGHYPESFLNEAVTMGGSFTRDSNMASKTYILGFTKVRYLQITY